MEQQKQPLVAEIQATPEAIEQIFALFTTLAAAGKLSAVVNAGLISKEFALEAPKINQTVASTPTLSSQQIADAVSEVMQILPTAKSYKATGQSSFTN
jgi:hypothetical protein